MFRQSGLPSLRFLPRSAQWAILSLMSAVLIGGLAAIQLPAAVLLGSMAGAILFAMGDGTLKLGHWPFALAQGVLGCLIARSITPAVLTEITADWPVVLFGVGAVILVSSGLGWLLARRQVLPGTTAIWGSAPGAASAMMLMAEAHGADVRLVAVMLYVRVVLVALAASVVARIWGLPEGAATAAAPWFPPVAPWDLAATLVVALAGAALGRVSRIPAGPLLLPMVLAALLQGFGLLDVVLPPWLLAASYTLVGWSIGLRFNRPILMYVARALPRLAASTMLLIAFCGAFAALLTQLVGLDPLTAYLATSPGGLDSVAIIAASSQADLAFIMAMQTARFLVVLAISPALARFTASKLKIPSQTV
ncbi:putative membrane protein AbrB [Acetobacteraceae bacterium AT-5844]|nr:putative membrane protein AbrB [Acetobacteraceae bacterium AT-5844]